MPVLIGRLRELAAPQTITKGMSYYCEGRVEIIEEIPMGVYYGQARGSSGNIYDFQLAYNETFDDIDEEETFCSCPAFGEYEGLCKHLVAAIMLVQNGSFLGMGKAGQNPKPVKPISAASEIAPPKIKSDTAALALIQSFAREIEERVADAKAVDDRQAPLHLEPTLVNDLQDGLSVTFRIGTEKLYIAKNLLLLKTDILAGNVMTLGKNTKIRLGIDCFAEDSTGLAAFITQYASLPQRYGYYYYSTSSNERKRIDLEGAALDAFFDAFSADTISYQQNNRHGKTQSTKLRIVRRDYRARIVLEAAESGGVRLRPTGHFLMIGAPRHMYVIEDETLYICSEACKSSCYNFLRRSSDAAERHR
ncbi:hypothetical protein AGMMS49983_18010 [Clostridia bacterium]|nr:hypothetical protein AGMMS49983_18010 [Clostridia bacterium]